MPVTLPTSQRIIPLTRRDTTNEIAAKLPTVDNRQPMPATYQRAADNGGRHLVEQSLLRNKENRYSSGSLDDLPTHIVLPAQSHKEIDALLHGTAEEPASPQHKPAIDASKIALPLQTSEELKALNKPAQTPHPTPPHALHPSQIPLPAQTAEERMQLKPSTAHLLKTFDEKMLIDKPGTPTVSVALLTHHDRPQAETMMGRKLTMVGKKHAETGVSLQRTLMTEKNHEPDEASIREMMCKKSVVFMESNLGRSEKEGKLAQDSFVLDTLEKNIFEGTTAKVVFFHGGNYPEIDKKVAELHKQYPDRVMLAKPLKHETLMSGIDNQFFSKVTPPPAPALEHGA